MYNITGFTDMQGFFGSINNYVGGWFWTLMLAGIAIVIFVSVRLRTTSDRAFFATGFGCWIFGTFMFYLGWINWMVYAATILALICGFVGTWVRQRAETS